MIRNTEQKDSAAIIAIVKESGQFDDDGIDHVRSTLEEHFRGDSEAL